MPSGKAALNGGGTQVGAGGSFVQICSTVMSEGGYTEAGREFSHTSPLRAVGVGSTVPIMAIRLGKDVPAVVPRWTTTKEKLWLVPAIIIFFLISMQIFKSLGESGQWLFVDTWIFTGTALATFGMSRGYVEFWLVWIAVDLVGVPFALSNGYYPTGILYALYLPFVIWGFTNWLKISKLEKEFR